MKLGSLLEKLGLWSDGVDDKLPAKPKSEEKKYEKKTVSLESLRAAKAEAAREIESGQASARLGLEATLPQIYTAAGLKDPEHGWTLERLGRELKDGDDVALVLAEHKIAPESLLEDGFRRDQALDRFEEHLDGKVQAFLASSKDKVAELEDQMRELAERAEKLRQEQRDVQERLNAWRTRKHASEDELERVAALVAPLVQKAAPKFSEGRKPIKSPEQAETASWAAPGQADASKRNLPPSHPAGWAPPIVPPEPD